MPWDKGATDAVIQQKSMTIQQTLDALPYYQELVTRGISGGQDQQDAAKRTIEGAIADIRSETNARRQMIQGIADQSQQANLPALTKQINTLAPEVEQQKTIYDLRTEQATVLANKYTSNWHSTWWEIWFPFGVSKPLSNTARTLIYVAAAGLVGTSVWAATRSSAKPAFLPPPQEGGRRKKRGSG